MSLRASKIFCLSDLPTTSVTMIINCLIFLETALISTYHKRLHIIEQSLLHMVQYHLLCNLQNGIDTKARRHFQHRKINLRRGKTTSNKKHYYRLRTSTTKSLRETSILGPSNFARECVSRCYIETTTLREQFVGTFKTYSRALR